jgi:hypothetical protein
VACTVEGGPPIVLLTRFMEVPTALITFIVGQLWVKLERWR